MCDALHISDLCGPNSDVGNATAAIQESSGCEFNLWIDRDRIKLPTLDGTSTSNHCSLITANQSPDGIFNATPGSLFMRCNASVAGRTAYVKTTGTGNTGSNALLERNARSTAGRPSLTSTGDRPFFYYNSDNEELETYFGPTFGWQTIDVLRTQALTGAGAIALGSRNTTLANATGATYAVTLAAPTAAQLGS